MILPPESPLESWACLPAGDASSHKPTDTLSNSLPFFWDSRLLPPALDLYLSEVLVLVLKSLKPPHTQSFQGIWLKIGSVQQKRHWCIEQSFGLCGRGRGWDDLGEWHWNIYNIIYGTSRQSRFDARYWMIGAGALGRPRGMVWGGRREEGSGWGTHVKKRKEKKSNPQLLLLSWGHVTGPIKMWMEIKKKRKKERK